MSFGQAVLHRAPSHYTVISTITLAPSPDRTMTRDKVRVPRVPSNHISGKRTSTSHSKCPPPTIANLTPNPWQLKKTPLQFHLCILSFAPHRGQPPGSKTAQNQTLSTTVPEGPKLAIAAILAPSAPIPIALILTQDSGAATDQKS